MHGIHFHHNNKIDAQNDAMHVDSQQIGFTWFHRFIGIFYTSEIQVKQIIADLKSI